MSAALLFLALGAAALCMALVVYALCVAASKDREP